MTGTPLNTASYRTSPPPYASLLLSPPQQDSWSRRHPTTMKCIKIASVVLLAALSGLLLSMPLLIVPILQPALIFEASQGCIGLSLGMMGISVAVGWTVIVSSALLNRPNYAYEMG